MCEFCNGKAKASEVLCGEGVMPAGLMLSRLFSFGRTEESENGDCVAIKDGNVMVYDNSSGEYRFQGIKINYCPICGKKLDKKR